MMNQREGVAHLESYAYAEIDIWTKAKMEEGACDSLWSRFKNGLGERSE